MKRSKVIFISGSGHCGSSLLALILGSHTRCFSIGELNSLPAHYREQLPIDCVTPDSEFYENLLGQQGLATMASVLGNTRIHPWVPLKVDKAIRSTLGKQEIFNPYTVLFQKLETDIIVDSSKATKWIVERLAAPEFKEGQIEAYLVDLVRDGRAVVNSYFKRFPSQGFEKITRGWVERLKQREALYTSFSSDRKIRVAYEALATQPETVIQKICRMVDIEFQPEALKFWEHEHHDISGNSGVYSLVNRYKNRPADGETSINGDYYQNHEIGIRLDERWKQEVSEENLEIFETIAGQHNRPYEWNAKTVL